MKEARGNSLEVEIEGTMAQRRGKEYQILP
jgi:hypothetical protein